MTSWRNGLRAERSRTSGSPAGLEEIPDPHDSEPLIEAEYRQYLLSSALELMSSEFPVKTWKACWEHVVMGRPAGEVAEELEICVGAVYVAKSRVLCRVRQELAGMLE